MEAAGYDVVLVETVGVGPVRDRRGRDGRHLPAAGPGPHRRPAAGHQEGRARAGRRRRGQQGRRPAREGRPRAPPGSWPARCGCSAGPRTAGPPRSLTCSAAHRDRPRRGVGAGREATSRCSRDSGELDRRRRDQQVGWMWSLVRDQLLDRLRDSPELHAIAPQLEPKSGTAPSPPAWPPSVWSTPSCPTEPRRRYPDQLWSSRASARVSRRLTPARERLCAYISRSARLSSSSTRRAGATRPLGRAGSQTRPSEEVTCRQTRRCAPAFAGERLVDALQQHRRLGLVRPRPRPPRTRPRRSGPPRPRPPSRCASRRPVSRSTSSPTACPYVSLICLKRSRSQNTTATGVRAASSSSSRSCSEHPVGQAGQRVAAGLAGAGRSRGRSARRPRRAARPSRAPASPSPAAPARAAGR